MPIRPISTSDKGQIEEAAGFGANIARKTLVFDDDTTPVAVFTVTGAVVARIVAEVLVDVESAGACTGSLGITDAVDTILASTDITTLEVGDIWHDATPDSDIELLSVMKDFIIAGGADIFLTLSAQADSGSIAFYCMWTPLSADGMVVAA